MKKIIPFILLVVLSFNCSKDEEIEQFELTTEISPLDGGMISPSNGKFDPGKEIELTATPAKGYFFKNWSGAVFSKENPLTITINSDKKIVAVFEKSDSDSDGIADDIDQCPETPEGEIVNDLGCSDTQNDTDKDGVTDDSDKCLDTPKDETVDNSGCSESQKDSDEDGVADNLDQCTETPEGETVDEQGCSESQKDSDGDGVNDGTDLCPKTPDGDTADDKGCSDCQKDSDVDGVTDDIDECPNTPKGETVDENGCVETLTTYIPDDIFEQQLIDLGYDDELDDHVLTLNIVNVESLLLYGDDDDSNALIDLTGLEDFLALKNLSLAFMNLSDYFNPSNYRNLTTLDLHQIGLNSLVIDEKSNLESLEFSNSVGALSVTSNNSLTNIFLEDALNNSIMISGNSKLTSFYTFDGHLGDVSITNNPALKSISFETIIIDSLTFSNNPALERFFLKPLNDIDFPLNFSTYSNLKDVELGYNGQFSSIDVSNNFLLERLFLENTGLTSLDISNNNLLSTFWADYNPSLTCIKVNQEQLDNIPSGWTKNPEANYSLDCSN